MNTAAALFLVAGFLVVARLLRMVPHAREVIARSHAAARDLRDPALDELAREKAIQGHAIRLAALFALLVATSLAALALPLGVVYLFELTGLVQTSAVVDSTLSPTFLIGVTAAVLVWTLARRNSRVEG